MHWNKVLLTKCLNIKNWSSLIRTRFLKWTLGSFKSNCKGSLLFKKKRKWNGLETEAKMKIYPIFEGGVLYKCSLETSAKPLKTNHWWCFCWSKLYIQALYKNVQGYMEKFSAQPRNLPVNLIIGEILVLVTGQELFSTLLFFSTLLSGRSQRLTLHIFSSNYHFMLVGRNGQIATLRIYQIHINGARL